MDKQRVQAYFNLIYQLLDCPGRQEPELLRQNSQLVDEGFLQAANYYAQKLKEDGQEQLSVYLSNLARKLSQANQYAPKNRHQVYSQLILSLRMCSSGEEAHILEYYEDILDDGLIVAFRQKVAELNKSEAIWFNLIVEYVKILKQSVSPVQQHFDLVKQIYQSIGEQQSEKAISNLLEKEIYLIDSSFGVALKKTYLVILQGLGTDNTSSVSDNHIYIINLIHNYFLPKRTVNYEIAIIGYMVVLTAISKYDFPHKWSNTINRLGNAYRERILGSKQENIELSINCHRLALEHLSDLKEQDYEWASNQNSLGLAYSERVCRDKLDNLVCAIQCFEQALKVFSETNYPLDWAIAQYNLGNTYLDRSYYSGHKSENVRTAITYYKNCLKVINKENFPKRWAKIHISLARAYSQLIVRNIDKYLNKILEHYNYSLEVFRQEIFPYDWALVQLNLGGTYLDIEQEISKNYIEKAINHYNQSLHIFTIDSYPNEWSRIQENIGIAYARRIKGDKKQNIELAISCFNSAIEVKNEEKFSIDWANIQNNLGSIYVERTVGSKKKNLEFAIKCFQESLKYINEDYGTLWSKINYNLGNSYIKLSTQGIESSENLNKARKYYLAILEKRKFSDFPQEWRATKLNLGTSYLVSYRVTSNIHYLNSAFICLSELLNKIDKVKFIVFYALIKHQLGVTYQERFKLNREQNNIKNAISCYQTALNICTPNSRPIDCLRTSVALGNFAYVESNYLLAVDAYAIAIDATEQTREEASNDDRKQEIISNAIEVYQNIVQACINLGQIDKAIEYVERGKARNLVDLLATRDLYPKGDIPQEVKDRLDDLRQETIAEEKRLSQQRDRRNDFGSFSTGDNRGLGSVVGNDEAINRDRLNNIRQELDNLVKKDILPVDPSFQLTQKVEPISFDKIRASLPSNKTVLIEWFIGKQTLSVFVVAAHMEQPLLISYSAEEYQVLFNRFSGYLDTYQQRDSQWHNQLDNLLTELAQSLKIELIIEQIEKLIPDCDRLILVPHRWLHLLPIHALPLADGKCLLDLFPQGVSYAPSVQLLELTQKQSKPQLNNLFAVQNPTEDLKFTDVEVQAVRSQFQPNDDVLTKQQATKSALDKERLGQANVTHFSCHGYFNFENPELSALLLAGSKVEKNQEDEDKGETRFLPSRDGGSIDLEHCLTLGEIFSLDLRNCRLVTLSACETGLTDFKSLSDEYIGLPSGFLYAGSPSVVSSLWAVSDISTSFLMIKFYQNLQEINSVAIALNQAQLWLRSVTKEELYAWSETLPLPIHERIPYFDAALQKLAPNTIPYASPYFWGAFCAVGS